MPKAISESHWGLLKTKLFALGIITTAVNPEWSFVYCYLKKKLKLTIYLHFSFNSTTEKYTFSLILFILFSISANYIIRSSN